MGATLEENRTLEGISLEEISVRGYEQVFKVFDQKSGLQAIICIHTTTLGPALGGVRIYPYPTFEDALRDVTRLARGMTYKAALAGTGSGGGKSVIISDAGKGKTREKLLAFGRVVKSLRGKYICAEDVGCGTEDVKIIAEANPYVVGLCHEKSSGNPSPFTAWGTFLGIQSALKYTFDNSSLKGRTVAIQGLGSVGMVLAEMLFWAGAKLIVADVNDAKVREAVSKFHAKASSCEEINFVNCDVLSPCALGGTINSQTIPYLNCRVIAGCANNQLMRDEDADELVKRGILYAPDFVINAGGLINVFEELNENGYDPIRSRNKVDEIYNQLMIIYDIAQQNGSSTNAAALSLGDYRLKYAIGKRMEPLYFHHSGVRL